MCGVTANDPPDVIRDRLGTYLADLAMDAVDVPAMYRVFELLLVGSADAGEVQLEGEAFRQQLFLMMRGLWQTLAQQAPIVMVCDDMHWTDAASVELLEVLFQLTESHRLLFICAIRPDEQVIGWRAREAAVTAHATRYTEIAIRPLDQTESGRLVTELFSNADLPPRLKELILDKASGNPFFLEETVRTLIEGGVLARHNGTWHVQTDTADIDLPDTLQGLLLARIDRLEEESRRTLQLAAVIGRSFYYRVLQALAETAGELDRRLAVLLQADLIREAARIPDLEYMFNHALTQEAAYQSILLKRRREFHRRVGEVMEKLFPQRGEELAPVLAHHFAAAGERQKAQHYFTLAGDVAYRLYANQEAAAHYRRALELFLADDRENTKDSETIYYLSGRLGRALELTANYGEALRHYERMEAWAQTHGDRSLALATLLNQATIRTTANPFHNPDEGRQLLEQARTLARELADQAAEAKILWSLMLLNTFTGGDVDERRALGEKSVELARALDLREQLAFSLLDVWYAYGGAGEWESAINVNREAELLWRELGNVPMLAETLMRMSYSYTVTGRYEEARHYADEALRLGQLSNNLESQAISRSIVGVTYLDRGEIEQGLSIMEEAVRLGEQVGSVTALGGARSDMGWVYGWLGNPVRGLEIAQTAVDWLKAHVPLVSAWAMASYARLLVQMGRLDEATSAMAETGSYQAQQKRAGFMPFLWVRTGLAEAELAIAQERYAEGVSIMENLASDMERAGVKYLLSDVHYTRACALLALKRIDEAERSLAQAHTEATALGSRRVLWAIHAAMGEVAAARGLPAEAENHYQTARQIVYEIANHIDRPELRTSFLQRPDVRSLSGDR
jgi:tetratricopeptide (TPR) repeat protein